MRWPWVSRLALDGALREVVRLREDVATLNCALERHRNTADERYERLLDRYDTLIQRKANTEGMAPAVLPVPKEVAPDLVLMEVATQAKGDPALHRYLMGYVSKLRAQKVDEGKILQTVSLWQSASVDEGIPAMPSIPRDGKAPDGFWPGDEQDENHPEAPVNAS